MDRGREARDLRKALRAALVERLEPSGWSALDDGRGGSVVCTRLVCPVTEGFEATAEVGLVSKLPDRPPLVVSDVRVGVAYEPLRRLWPLLGDRFQLSVLSTSTRRPDVEDHADARPLLEVASEREVAGAAETLARVILDRSIPIAEQHSSLEALTAALRDDEDPEWVDIRVPALLAAAERFDEAAAILSRYEPPEEPGVLSRRERRTAYQLRRWIEGRGDVSLLPDGPPPSRLDHRARDRSFRTVWADQRARREAVDEVRAAGRGQDRERLRIGLEEALGRRGLSESPLSLEATLDHLRDTPGDSLRRGLAGLKALGRFGLAVAKAVRDEELPDLSVPSWLEPLDPAFYELPLGDRWVRVSLAAGLNDWLDRAYQVARPKMFGVASLDAWLKPEADPAEPGQLGVHVGEKRVGVIPADVAQAYSAAMEAAAFRQELPYLPARLAQRGHPPTYMLELAVPPPNEPPPRRP